MIICLYIFIFLCIFMIGAFFGSFFSLATYRIPKGEDITHTRSYCPNCKHKLSFFDLFPVISYIVRGGKCKYCKQKISPRYILLESLMHAALFREDGGAQATSLHLRCKVISLFAAIENVK